MTSVINSLCRPANSETFLSRSFSSQSHSGRGKVWRAAAEAQMANGQGWWLRLKAEVGVRFLVRGQQASSQSARVLMVFHGFGHWKMPLLNKKCHAGFESASGSSGFCTRMRVCPASGGSVGRSAHVNQPSCVTYIGLNIATVVCTLPEHRSSAATLLRLKWIRWLDIYQLTLLYCACNFVTYCFASADWLLFQKYEYNDDVCTTNCTCHKLHAKRSTQHFEGQSPVYTDVWLTKLRLFFVLAFT